MFGDRLIEFGRKTAETISELSQRIPTYAQKLKEEIPILINQVKSNKVVKTIGLELLGISAFTLLSANGAAAISRLGGFEMGLVSATILIGVSALTQHSLRIAMNRGNTS